MYIVHGIWYSVIDTVLVSPADTVTYSYSPCIAQSWGPDPNFENPCSTLYVGFVQHLCSVLRWERVSLLDFLKDRYAPF